MNCRRCNTPNPPDARFCLACGFPVSYDRSTNEIPTVPQQQWQYPQYTPPPQPALPMQSYSAGTSMPEEPGTMPSTGAFPPPPVKQARSRKGPLWVRIALMLTVVGLLLTTGWFVGLRPYLHMIVNTQIDQALASAVNQMNTNQFASLPPEVFEIHESELNQLITQNTSTSDLVKNLRIRITTTGLRVEFQTYGFPCAITGMLNVTADKQLIVTDVGVEGILSLVMSGDEMTALLSKYTGLVQLKLQHTVGDITYKDQELDLTLA